jgi:hypothetical protein
MADPRLLVSMEYATAVRTVVMMEVVDLLLRVDRIKEITVEASWDAEDASDSRREMMELGVEMMELGVEMMELGVEMMELGVEMMECREVMMLMQNVLMDVTRVVEDMKVQWDQEREDLLTIQVRLMEQVGNLQVVVYNLQGNLLSGCYNPIVLDLDDESDGGDADVEMAVEDEISLWSWDVDGRDGFSTQETLVGDQVVYELVPIESLTQ